MEKERPEQAGLYRSEFEHDNCGIGFVNPDALIIFIAYLHIYRCFTLLLNNKASKLINNSGCVLFLVIKIVKIL